MAAANDPAPAPPRPYDREGALSSPAGPRGEPLPDRLLDDVMPEQLEWKRLVRSYPKTCLLLALAGGFYLGRRRGREIVETLADFAADTVTETVNHAVGRDLL